MRIHTNLTLQGMYDALRDSGAQDTIDFHKLTEHGSRTHARAFDVRLTGIGGHGNTGLYGAGDYSGATWDEWGAFLGSLFDMDPEARCGSAKHPTYRDRDHYHFLTGDRFQCHYPCDGCKGTYLPADTHKRHHWRYDGFWGDRGASGFQCTRCSAHRPSWQQAEAYAPRAYDVAEVS